MRQTKVNIPLFLVFIGAIVLATHLPVLASRVLTNYGMSLLLLESEKDSYAVSPSGLEQARRLLRQAGEWDPSNLTVQRGLALVYWQFGEDEKALQEWEKVGYAADDYITFARQIPQQLVDTRFRWYRLAEQVQPDNAMLWLEVGMLCQNEIPTREFCLQFLAYNNQSWLVDPGLLFGRATWKFNRHEGVVYDIVQCPGMPDKTCAVVGIGNNTPKQGASWHQCLFVEPGKEYLFSAWIKVDVINNGLWRPVYFQGNMENEPRGYWPGDQRGSMSWSYWEYRFIFPVFDDHRACFHPVRLQASGAAWFRDARLVVIK